MGNIIYRHFFNRFNLFFFTLAVLLATVSCEKQVRSKKDIKLTSKQVIKNDTGSGIASSVQKGAIDQHREMLLEGKYMEAVSLLGEVEIEMKSHEDHDPTEHLCSFHLIAVYTCLMAGSKKQALIPEPF